MRVQTKIFIIRLVLWILRLSSNKVCPNCVRLIRRAQSDKFKSLPRAHYPECKVTGKIPSMCKYCLTRFKTESLHQKSTIYRKSIGAPALPYFACTDDHGLCCAFHAHGGSRNVLCAAKPKTSLRSILRKYGLFRKKTGNPSHTESKRLTSKPGASVGPIERNAKPQSIVGPDPHKYYIW